MSWLPDWLRILLRRPPLTKDGGAYRVYTRAFDLEVRAEHLDGVLGRLGARERAGMLDAWQALDGALAGWRTTATLEALTATGRIRAARGGEPLSDTIVSVLVDQSGSMRGQKMLLAAAAVDIAQDFVRTLGCEAEVLGFTTTSWRGGRSRQRWAIRGRPRRPGRLCDLLHIVYRAPGDPGSGVGGHWLQSMLRPDLPKENVDGEALQWATGRLAARPETRKILVIMSDGAPVDDSTLMENGPLILADHLREVIREIEGGGKIRLAALGVGHDVAAYYSKSAVVASPDDLGIALIGLIERMIIASDDNRELGAAEAALTPSAETTDDGIAAADHLRSPHGLRNL